MRPKPIATLIDLETIVLAAYQDKRIFRTNRMKIQFITICLVSALSSERPGAIMESDCYRHSNEAVLWGDLEFYIFPNKKDPSRPLLGIILCIRNQKAHRDDPSFRKWFFLWLEPFGNRANCSATLLSSLAIEDGVFEDVPTMKDILCPKIAPTEIHKLTIKSSHLKQPVFRAEVLTERGWEISESAALKACMHRKQLHLVCFFRGFMGEWFGSIPIFLLGFAHTQYNRSQRVCIPPTRREEL